MNYDLFIPKDVEDQWDDYVRLVSTEIAVMGLVTVDHENHLFIVDTIFLVPQQISGSEVDFIDRGLHYAIDRAMAMDRLEDLRFCAHSHVNMATNWSSTDEDMIDKIGLTGVEWFISLVSNKRGDHTARFDIWISDDRFFDRQQIRFDKLPITWESDAGKADDEERIKEIEQFCRKAPAPAKPNRVGTSLVVSHTPRKADGSVPGKAALRKFDKKRFTVDSVKTLCEMHPDEFIKLVKKEDWAYIEDPGDTENGYGYLYFHDKGGTVKARRLATDDMIGLVLTEDIPGDMTSLFEAIEGEDPEDLLSREAWLGLGAYA